MDIAISYPVLLLTTVPAIPAHIGWGEKAAEIEDASCGVKMERTHGQAGVADDVGSLAGGDTGEPATNGIGRLGLELVRGSHGGQMGVGRGNGGR